MTVPITDKLSRPLRDLRISVTDRCNFRCPYCMPKEIFHDSFPFLNKEDLLSNEEWLRLARCFARLGVHKIRITGGEPLLRPDLPDLITELSTIPEIDDIALTTNGSLLGKQAESLKQAGLKRVTVSLDSLQDERFGKMNGVGFAVQPILDHIDHAAKCGLGIKINMVVKKGSNDQDIIPMARYFKNKGYTLRFIEYMDVGNKNQWKQDEVVPMTDIIEMINEEMPIKPVDPIEYGEVAKRYQYTDNTAEIGIISSVTHPFCSDCTRARISAEGQLYTCLFASNGHDLKPSLRENRKNPERSLEEELRNIWEKRSDRYSETRSLQSPEKSNSEPKVEMWRIGG